MGETPPITPLTESSMPAYHVESSILINASAADVHLKLDNFQEWPIWSPWLYMEPDTKLDYRGQSGQIGHGYDWKGDLTGAGNMTLTHIDANELKMDLQFLKPFKSKAKISFDVIEKSPKQTLLTWHMDSSLPFFMFFMTGKIKSMITSDYNRGLKLLKDYVENGKVNSKTVVDGLVDVTESSYIGTTSDSSMKHLSESMRQTIPAVVAAIEKNNLSQSGPVHSIYNRMNIKQQSCVYTAAIPVTDTTDVNTPMHIGAIQACRALKVTHTGSYDHLGTAWATAIGNQRHLKLKPSKVQPPYEVYISDPENTPADKLITEIYVPIR